MGIVDWLDKPLSAVPPTELAARSWPFDLVAPLAAWYWISTDFRDSALPAFAHLKSLDFEAIIACSTFDEVCVKADSSLLGSAYHRALLEIVAPVHPHWRVQCNDLGQLCLGGSSVDRAQGQQFGMLAVFPDAQSLADHLSIRPVLTPGASAKIAAEPAVAFPARQRPSLSRRR